MDSIPLTWNSVIRIFNSDRPPTPPAPSYSGGGGPRPAEMWKHEMMANQEYNRRGKVLNIVMKTWHLLIETKVGDLKSNSELFRILKGYRSKWKEKDPWQKEKISDFLRNIDWIWEWAGGWNIVVCL